MKNVSITKKDYVIALLVFTVIAITAFCSLNYNCPFMDDFAAYMNEGIAIAEESFHEQTRINYLMHPMLPVTALGENTRTYAWGYPLLLSAVYRLVGFERVDFSELIYYKLVSVLAFGIFASAYYLFLRRRFQSFASFAGTMIFCSLGSEFFIFANTLYSDLVFLCFEMLTFLAAERYLSRLSAGKLFWPQGILLGVLLWFTYETRTVGSIIAVFALLPLIFKAKEHELSLKKRVSALLAPLAVVAALMFVSEKLLLARATAETSELGKDLSFFFPNVKKYLYLVFDWLSGWTVWKVNIRYLKTVVFLSGGIAGLLLLISLTNKPAKKDCLYLVFSCVYFVGSCLMAYSQGLRYVYPILPFLFLFLMYGVQAFFHAVAQNKNMKKLKNALLLAIAVLFFLSPLQYASANLKNQRYGGDTGAYSASAKEVYRYINKNTPKNSIFSFYESRALYLNTGRLSVPNQLIYNICDTDYFLESTELGFYLPEKEKNAFEIVFANDQFRLYRNCK